MRGALAVIGQMAVAVVVAVVICGDLACRDIAGAVAGVQLVEPAARVDHRRPIRLPGRGVGFRPGLAPRMAQRSRGVRRWCPCPRSRSSRSPMPLGATKLYLFGISVDQQFRTEYLTRLTDTAGPHDMTYYGLPPFYPPGWFWIGGRLATLTGTPAWEIFKPWAIISITIAVRAGFRVVGQHDSLRVRADRVDRHRRGDARVLDHRALRRDHRRAAAAGVRARRGRACGARTRGMAAGPRSSASASSSASPRCSTPCCSAYAAFTLTIMAVVLVVARRRLEPLLRLAVIARDRRRRSR